MTKISAELEEELKVFLPHAREDIPSLAFLYHAAFGVQLNTRCNLCVNDGIQALQKLLQRHLQTQKPNHTMQKFKWTSDEKYAHAKVTMRVGGKLTSIHAHNLTDNTAQVLRNSSKYMHLIEEADAPVTAGEQTAKSETTPLPTSADITSTSILPPNEEKTAKRRKKKQA